MAHIDIKARYLQYIETLNGELLPGSLDAYIKDGIVFNNFPPLSPDECVQNVQQVKSQLPGLYFDIEWLILEKDPGAKGEQGFANLAVRANISYNPEPGEKLTFVEHCFYRLEEGKLWRSQSVVDVWGLPQKDQAIARNL